MPELHIVTDSCCQRYIAHCLDGMESDAKFADVHFPTDTEERFTIRRAAYIEAIRDTADLLLKIIDEGKPCPWHDGVPEDYLRIMHMMGAKDV